MPAVTNPASSREAERIPRRIWFLWLQGLDEAPPVVRMCYESWRQQNPGWELIFLTAENVGDWVDFQPSSPRLSHLSRNHLSDLIRIALLSKYGGVWVDSTCLCVQDLDRWLEKAQGMPAINFHLLDLIKHRDVSNKIAEDFSVCHESPQVLLIINGKCVYDESHSGISMKEIAEQLILN
ncbi:DUF2847 family protein, partial [Lacticaseibacillus rhamnosus]